MESSKIGLVVEPFTNLFANGMVQNIWFLYEVLGVAGLRPEFLCHAKDPTPFAEKGVPIVSMDLSSTTFSITDYYAILTISTPLNDILLTECAKHNVHVVDIHCGNDFMCDIEDFVRGCRDDLTSFVSERPNVREMWILPHHGSQVDYLTILRKMPVKIIPYLWTPEFVNASAKTDLQYTPKSKISKINIIILEPNLNILKSAWVPIVGSEKLYLESPDFVNQVFAFSFPSINTPWNMTHDLRLTKDKKLRRFQRLPISEILEHMNREEEMPIFVSHQIENGLNYLYNELLYYGYPLVHNSRELNDCGYFYEGNNFNQMVLAIRTAHAIHNECLDIYKKKAERFLAPMNPSNKETAQIYRSALQNLKG